MPSALSGVAPGCRGWGAELAIEHDLNGRHLDVVAELEALVAAEPLRERAHAQRMLACTGPAGRTMRSRPTTRRARRS
jgi:hypothetical protein